MKTLRLVPLFACIFAGIDVGLYTAARATPFEPLLAGLSVYAILFALYTIKATR